MKHVSVLLHETVDLLNVKPDGIYVDGTLGRGGHAGLLISKLENGHLYAFDKDETAIEESKINLKDHLDKVTFIHDDFRHMKEALHERGIEAVDGVMMDLGVSSPQFDDPTRGFSYRYDARLDMRMDKSQSLDAWQVVNTYEYSALVRILQQYGEERYAKQIARAIERKRKEHSIDTTFELVDVIRSALPERVLHGKGHPAKQTFQALRIEVNDELGQLRKALQDALALLKPKGRIAVISFHSLEDRIVKQFFQSMAESCKCPPGCPVCICNWKPKLRILTRKPVTAETDELRANPRAACAKLRAAEKTEETDGKTKEDSVL